MANEEEYNNKLDVECKSSIGIPSLCFECDERIICGHFDKGTVKLFCECIIAWCQVMFFKLKFNLRVNCGVFYLSSVPDANSQEEFQVNMKI